MYSALDVLAMVRYIGSIRMLYYGSGTGVRCCKGVRHTLCFHSPDGITFMREMTSWPPFWNCDVKSEIRLRQSIDSYYLEERSCKASSRSDLKRRSVRLFKEVVSNNNNNNNNNKMSSDMWTVPGLKTYFTYLLVTYSTCIGLFYWFVVQTPTSTVVIVNDLPIYGVLRQEFTFPCWRNSVSFNFAFLDCRLTFRSDDLSRTICHKR